MWKRFADRVCCPACKGPLALAEFSTVSVDIPPELESIARDQGILDERFNRYVESGLLLCRACEAMFPIMDGLPIMLCYETPVHAKFIDRYGVRCKEQYSAFRFLDNEPASGERAVMNSFSREWLDYDYDGIIWEMSYEDHERRFLKEIGIALTEHKPSVFLEAGCGLGITTYLAHKNSSGDAVGLDLSLAVWKACRHYRSNPFVHFVQASVFAPPFLPNSFDVVYSRGVLHHTFSTQRAFKCLALLCRSAGTLYVWVYGKGSIEETAFRRVVYLLERIFRPALSAAPNSHPARVFLGAMGIAYVVFNGMRRIFNPAIQPLTLARGIHAARDRFTPQFAHRHDASEVTGWFRDAGFASMEVIDWRGMPPADHDDFRRNVGVRGRLLHAT
jgi:uncharacterized protein YbaR (Trm112 family)/SAM-dependent methyltransferase